MRRLDGLLRTDDWPRPVPTFILTGELDPFVNVEDIRLLYERLAGPKYLVVVGKAGHVHFADGAATTHEQLRLGYLSGAFSDPELQGSTGVRLGEAMRPFADLLTEEQGGSAARALCLAHMDARLRHSQDAQTFLESDIARAFASRGICVEHQHDAHCLA